MEEIKFHLVLTGSFFPMHDGHLNLLEAGRNYILSHPEFRNVNVFVDKIIILPTHPKSLAKKHKLKNLDYWQFLLTKPSELTLISSSCDKILMAAIEMI